MLWDTLWTITFKEVIQMVEILNKHGIKNASKKGKEYTTNHIMR